MADKLRTAISDQVAEERALSDRRDFVKKAGKVAIAVPAVALLLSMKTQSAGADAFATSGLDVIR